MRKYCGLQIRCRAYFGLQSISAHLIIFVKAHTVFHDLLEETKLAITIYVPLYHRVGGKSLLKDSTLATDLGQATLIRNWASRQNKVFSKLCDIVQMHRILASNIHF